MSKAPFIAVDWGTTNRRAYRIEQGAVAATFRDDRGVKAMAGLGYGAEVAAIRGRLGDLPMLMAGMVGSTIGWREAPYARLPAGLPALASSLLAIDDRTAIVPGMSLNDGTRSDVMRGEEVQLLGAVAAGLAPADALLCQPGTHCKWVRMTGGEVTHFATAMTGEIFALLKDHSILAAQLTGDVLPCPAFVEGVRRGAQSDLATALFGIRAASVLGTLKPDDAPSRASGILIGADVAAQVEAGDAVHILADPTLGALYASAIETLGGTATLVDSHAAFVAGIVAIQELRS
ncbi:2-dehydro-3-deoxygalactonokinase [Sphingomonas sp. AX6]|uniref:2-dehydro-3-deoxygalactonokinase n=1 Tax=Sphingomonas sp. AX6 TaxID=2653171 RepID=UPI0012F2C286|nr:2-dehydro-3-deoxygalactonokinase [Sphingomonas sp. AX6]VXC73250.1 2-dehydro-3-deoxygalactonokinase [Sphingomonas sp. AX6]